MAIIFDEVTATVQPPTPPESGSGGRESVRPDGVADPLELARLLERLRERAARLNAD